MFPAIGSIITAASSFLIDSKTSKKASMSLYGILIVCLASSSGTPGESGKPKVETPEPAFIRREST